MKIHIVGAGPAGLYFAILMKRLDPAHEITIMERDGPDDTFGWGIVFSDQTFSYLAASDEPSYERIVGAAEFWDNVDVVHRGTKITIGGNGFSGIGRLVFLQTLHARCRELGVDLVFRRNLGDHDPLPACDLLIGADGANSTVRRRLSAGFDPSLEMGRNKYVWLGTPRLFHGLTLTFRETDEGMFAAHAYKFSPTTSTFIVECSEQTWRHAGFERRSDASMCTYLQRVFADDLQGRPLLTNDFVRWRNFVIVKNRRWHYEHVALLGDALHTAHFSIGSGTKLALGDAIELARCFGVHGAVPAALAEFEATRKPVIEAYQDAAYESLLWFETMEAQAHLEPLALAYSIMTRSKRIDREKLRQRDPAFVAAYERASGASGGE
jgi:anthraniloyl-CoA monooxygenase